MASFHSKEQIAPSNHGIKHLGLQDHIENLVYAISDASSVLRMIAVEEISDHSVMAVSRLGSAMLEKIACGTGEDVLLAVQALQHRVEKSVDHHPIGKVST